MSHAYALGRQHAKLALFGDPHEQRNNAIKALVATQGANMAAGVTSMLANRSGGLQPGEVASAIGDYAQQMGVKGPINIQHVPQLVGNAGVRPFAEGSKHLLAHGSRPGEALLAHELGHLRLHEALGPRVSGALLKLRHPALTGLGLPAAAAWSGYQKDPTWAPGALTAGITAPMLLDEAAASAQAARALIRKKGLLRGLGHSAKLLPAFASYAALGLGPLAITAYRKHQ